jgi:hypothetical protein
MFWLEPLLTRLQLDISVVSQLCGKVHKGKIGEHTAGLSYAGAVRKVTSSERLTKEGMRKKLLYTKNTYILKLLLNIATVGIEALVSGSKFCMTVKMPAAFYPLSPQHGAYSGCGWRKRPPDLRQQSPTPDREWSSSLRVWRGAYSSPQKQILLRNVTKSLGLERILLINDSS